MPEGWAVYVKDARTRATLQEQGPPTLFMNRHQAEQWIDQDHSKREPANLS